jgi:poly-beta-hydroxyalkanoate depolymerase
VEYRKEYLGDWADSLDVNKLLGEHDFQRYLNHLRWIIKDP